MRFSSPVSFRIQEQAHGFDIKAIHAQSLLDGCLQPRVSVLPTQQEYVDHGAGPWLLASALLQHLPEAIETGRPTSLCPPLLERCRTSERSGLLRQCFQVVLQVEYFLLPVEAAFVSCQALSLVPNLYVGRVHLGLHFDTDRQRNRIEVG